MALKFLVISFMRRNSSENYAVTALIISFLRCNVFGKIDSYSAKIIICWYVCDPGPEKKSVEFYRLQLRLRPKLSTPTDSNPGFNSY